MSKLVHVASTAAACALAASAAFADAGVVEINHTCASGPGCFIGDGAGYPVEIDGQAGHSYRLTSDLRLDNPALFNGSSTAIAILADRITLDLGGFQIFGPCLNGCPSGTGDGVSASARPEAR